ncbi:uncharacterized protein LOC135386424 [Ornithodoros turicata]|uniref:uncharacterized protein LOC135386424 n=1 Tax=Ornithodoros turicata TaxID=34597 RepID=UPI00313913EC
MGDDITLDDVPSYAASDALSESCHEEYPAQPTGSSVNQVLKEVHKTVLALEARLIAFQVKCFQHNKEMLLMLKQQQKQQGHALLALHLPDGCPQLPATTFLQLEEFDRFLEGRENMSMTVSVLHRLL